MAAAPRRSLLTGTIKWSDGSNFNGYLLLGIAMPSSGSAYTYVGMSNDSPIQRIPQFCTIPIIDGAFNPAAKVFYNEDLEPPTSKYVPYWYDAQKRLISGPGALFVVSTETTPIVAPTLTVPTAPTIPTTVPEV
jgi:hypothetical protein